MEFVTIVLALVAIYQHAADQRFQATLITVLGQIQSTLEERQDCDADSPEAPRQSRESALPLRGTTAPDSSAKRRKRGAKSKRRK
jgi:hypothetical protein